MYLPERGVQYASMHCVAAQPATESIVTVLTSRRCRTVRAPGRSDLGLSVAVIVKEPVAIRSSDCLPSHWRLYYCRLTAKRCTGCPELARRPPPTIPDYELGVAGLHRPARAPLPTGCAADRTEQQSASRRTFLRPATGCTCYAVWHLQCDAVPAIICSAMPCKPQTGPLGWTAARERHSSEGASANCRSEVCLWRFAHLSGRTQNKAPQSKL